MRDDDTLLLDMLLASREARDFAASLHFEEFQHDRKTQLAIRKSIEIVGEAASRVSAVCKETYPEIPWSQIIGMRNRLVHVYFDINLERVWETVQQDVPRLISQLESLPIPGEE